MKYIYPQAYDAISQLAISHYHYRQIVTACIHVHVINCVYDHIHVTMSQTNKNISQRTYGV